MINIGRTIFYDTQTGNIIVDTGERTDLVKPTIEQYLNSYVELKDKNREIIGIIELEFGQYQEDFQEGYLVGVDIETEELLFEYIDRNQPGDEPEIVIQKPLTKQVEELKAADLDNKEAIATLFEMVLMGGM